MHQHEHLTPHEHFVKPGLKQSGHRGRHPWLLDPEKQLKQLQLKHLTQLQLEHLKQQLGDEHFGQLGFEQCKQLGVEHVRHLGHLNLIPQQQHLVDFATVAFGPFGKRRVWRIFFRRTSVVMFSISWTNLQRW